MDDLDEIRRRMRQRHHHSQPVLNDRQFNRLYRWMIRLMLAGALVLGVGTYMRASGQGEVFTQWISEHLSLAKYQDWIDTHLLSVIPFFHNETTAVDGPVSYEAIDETHFTAPTSAISAIGEGVVIAADEKSVTIEQTNGIQAVYGDLSEVEVALYDHVQSGDLLGYWESAFSLQFSYEGQAISYEEALAMA